VSATEDQEQAAAMAAMGAVVDEPAPKPPRKRAPRKAAAPKPAKAAPRKRAPRKAAALPAVVEAVEAEVVEDEGQELVLEHEDPAYRVYLLRLAGMSWPEIVLRTPYEHTSGARLAYSAYAQRMALMEGSDIAQERQQEALARAEAVMSANYDAMMAGDKDAGGLYLKANADWYRMAGLEKADVRVNSQQTILITGGPDMAMQLREQVEARDAETRRKDDAAAAAWVEH
jgi:hypothetical protein